MGPKLNVERQLRSPSKPSKPTENQFLMPRRPTGPSTKPIDVPYVAAETKHAMAQAFSLKATVKINFNLTPQPQKQQEDEEDDRVEVFFEEDDDYLYRLDKRYFKSEVTECRFNSTTQQPLKPVPYKSIWVCDHEARIKYRRNNERYLTNDACETYFMPNDDERNAPIFTFYKKKFFKRSSVQRYIREVDVW